MAERSQIWDTNGTGDGPLAGYSETQTEEFLPRPLDRRPLRDRRRAAGVAGDPRLHQQHQPGDGRGRRRDGLRKYYQNTSSLAIAVTSPVVGTTGLRVVLRVNWAAQTVRATVVRTPTVHRPRRRSPSRPARPGTSRSRPGPSPPGVDQPHRRARVLPRPDGARLPPAGREQQRLVDGRDDQHTPGETWRELGVVAVSFTSGTGTATVTFPVAFAQPPVVSLTVHNGGSSTKRKLNATIESVSASQLVVRVYLTDGSTSSSSADVHWTAEGPAA